MSTSPPSHRRLSAVAAQVCASAEVVIQPPVPLGSIEGAAPSLRAWSVEQLGTRIEGDVPPPAEFPLALPGDHPATEQFRKYGYIAVTDAVAPAALRRNIAVFKEKQIIARQVYETSLAEDPSHQQHRTYSQMFDLPREDMEIGVEAWNSGAWGGFLVTKKSADFDAYTEILANPQILPLLLSLVGDKIHIMEAGARTVPPPPPAKHQAEGGYTEWHRDYGSQPDPKPIGIDNGDNSYNRVKCFVYLKDVHEDGGPLGLVPGSHLWEARPPPEFSGANMTKLPGHVKCAAPAGAMLLFDM